MAALPFAVVHTIATARALRQRVSKAFTPQHARLPEICDCHADAWIPGRSRKRRLTVLKRYGMDGPCCMQGRRIAWFVAEGMACLVRDILRNTTSESMQQLPAAMPTARHGEIVAAYEQLRIDLLETLTEKLMHFQHAPYAATGALYYEYGGPLTRAHQFLKLCSGDLGRSRRKTLRRCRRLSTGHRPLLAGSAHAAERLSPSLAHATRARADARRRTAHRRDACSHTSRVSHHARIEEAHIVAGS